MNAAGTDNVPSGRTTASSLRSRMSCLTRPIGRPSRLATSGSGSHSPTRESAWASITATFSNVPHDGPVQTPGRTYPSVAFSRHHPQWWYPPNSITISDLDRPPRSFSKIMGSLLRTGGQELGIDHQGVASGAAARVRLMLL